MKRIISLCSLLLAALLCRSCISTEVIGFVEPPAEPPAEAVADSAGKKERPTPPRPPAPPQDTTADGRMPIGWDASVEDWEESEVDH